MDAKTLEALKASIAKWEMNAETAKAGVATGSPIKWGYLASKGVIGIGVEGCPLCDLFYEDGCNGCPVRQRSEKPCCLNTPYLRVNDIVPPDYGDFASSGELVAACEAEVAFLRSLLPAEG
ncbi:MAG: hypothetical protein ACLGJC_09480 [Alphaproteobacteria bacterium]